MLAIGARNDEPKPTQTVPPNSSFVLLDSKARDTSNDPNPCSFLADLGNSASGARRIIHRLLQWSQPIYTHNLTDWELIISFSTDSFAQKYVCYMFPWYTFTNFSGVTKDSEDFAVPDPRSYCAMVTEALQNGLRLIEAPTVPAPPAAAARLECRYSRNRGLLIALDQRPDPDPADYFRIEPCSWLNIGHNIHGFGNQIEVSPGNYEYRMEPRLFAKGVNNYFSSAAPIGIYTREVFVTSREICRNRKLTSFTNLRQGGETAATELTTVQCLFPNLNVQKNYETTVDPTVINLRDGDNLQHMRINIIDEFGNIVESGLLSGNPFELFYFETIASGAAGPFDMSGVLYDPTNSLPVYSNTMITSALTNEFYRRYQFQAARIDQSTAITHYLELVMF